MLTLFCLHHHYSPQLIGNFYICTPETLRLQFAYPLYFVSCSLFRSYFSKRGDLAHHIANKPVFGWYAISSGQPIVRRPRLTTTAYLSADHALSLANFISAYSVSLLFLFPFQVYHLGPLAVSLASCYLPLTTGALAILRYTSSA